MSEKPERPRRTVFFVSDRTGITAETLGHSLLTQFDGIEFRPVTVPFIGTKDKAEDVARRINETAEEEGWRPLVFSTLITDECREIVKAANGMYLDFFDAFIGPLERELRVTSSHAAGRAHGVFDAETYTRRIDAMNFALANDDGITTRHYDRAEVILVGVSRSGKTPTCLYLALHYGVYAANYPLTPDDLEDGKLPKSLEKHKSKLYGLTIDPVRLKEIRNERRPDSNYASTRQVTFEVGEAEFLFRRYGIPFISTTTSSVEEIATTVLHSAGLQRRFY
ncbi:posphoenolpyruvate synthetase regulatory kinase/phosphorylase PpsR [Natronospira bacteriovora]|uniref:Putative phosphoenolpyruvate synthase regulatory protein n=1 Tax=Natronospira bacteriovora TaxID=3069753 RepID=A0ABU0W313_9GAMM|nr:pyruvate, water dikinase regulatory protein [Natronospira sp. AB-CW4]MDQ2068405.1 pyruvate, water dikinase regulatory protein [Natronospira sp. AB-CW4]